MSYVDRSWWIYPLAVALAVAAVLWFASPARANPPPETAPYTPTHAAALEDHRHRLELEALRDVNGPYTSPRLAPTPPPARRDPPPPGRSTPPGPGVEQWRQAVAAVFPAGAVDEALGVMACESGGVPSAQHPRSRASGLFQFVPGTWAAFGVGDPFDPVANIAAADRLWSHGHPRAGAAPNWGHWVCQPNGTHWGF